MPILHAVVLGVVQALSEFLPISSSGHLHLVRWLLGWDELPDQSAQAFDVAVHMGTLAGATAYLRRDVARYAAAALAPLAGLGPLSRDGRIGGMGRSGEGGASPGRASLSRDGRVGGMGRSGEGGASPGRASLSRDGRIGWALAASAAPAGVAGVVLGDVLQGSGRVWAIAVALIVFGVLLGLSDLCREGRSVEDFSFGAALVMGVAQALALQPGVSRSGVTITAARGLGFSRDAAVRLAFLMSLPVIAGAGAYGLIGLSVPSSMWPALASGAAAAAAVGWVAVWATVRAVARLGLKPFVVYRISVGLAVLAAMALNWR